MRITRNLICIGLLIIITISACKKYRFEPEVNFDAAYVVNGGDNTISVIDLNDGQVKTTRKIYNADWPHHISLSPDKKLIAVGIPGEDLTAGHGGGHIGKSPKGKIIIAGAQSGKKEERITLDAMNHNVIFSPDGSELWTSQMESNGKVLIFDTKNFKEKHRIEVGSMPAEITFSHDGKFAFVANGGSNTVTAIRVSDKSIAATINVGENPVGAWTGSDNKMYVDNETEKTVSVIDVNTLTVEETVQLGFIPGMAAYHARTNELWVTAADSGKAVYFKRSGNEWIKEGRITTGAGAHGIVFSSNGLKAYVTNQFAGTVSVIDVTSKSVISTINVGSKPNGIVLRYF